MNDYICNACNIDTPLESLNAYGTCNVCVDEKGIITPKKYVAPAYEDPNNSYDLFDISRKNRDGGDYCVAAAILLSQVDFFWNNYIDYVNQVNKNKIEG